MVRFIDNSSQAQLAANPLSRFFARLIAWLIWLALACIGLLFMLVLLGGFVLMLVYSLVKGWVTGRPSAPAQLWHAWRQMAGQRWAYTTGGARRSGGPEAPETPQQASAAARRSGAESVQDVSWREVPRQPDKE